MAIRSDLYSSGMFQFEGISLIFQLDIVRLEAESHKLALYPGAAVTNVLGPKNISYQKTMCYPGIVLWDDILDFLASLSKKTCDFLFSAPDRTALATSARLDCQEIGEDSNS